MSAFHWGGLTSASWLAKLGIRTYGSPTGHLYDTYFPSARFTHLAPSSPIRRQGLK